MNEVLASWWRARTERERLLLSVALWLAFVVAAPLMVWQSASAYRQDAAARLAQAESMRELVGRLDPALVRQAPLAGQGLQDIVAAEAAARQLTIARIEPQGPDRLRFVFEPGDSLAVLTLIDALTRGGLAVDQTVLIRTDEVGRVTAELDVRGRGS